MHSHVKLKHILISWNYFELDAYEPTFPLHETGTKRLSHIPIVAAVCSETGGFAFLRNVWHLISIRRVSYSLVSI